MEDEQYIETSEDEDSSDEIPTEDEEDDEEILARQFENNVVNDPLRFGKN